eukprot:GHVU01015386.1.p1 GENE.GHVU01015386.1~~GHVU01015386.1.p1  ORF type:complete len:137 (-),score=0.17 GHVU01015386.1:755-1165(-)
MGMIYYMRSCMNRSIPVHAYMKWYRHAVIYDHKHGWLPDMQTSIMHQYLYEGKTREDYMLTCLYVGNNHRYACVRRPQRGQLLMLDCLPAYLFLAAMGGIAMPSNTSTGGFAHNGIRKEFLVPSIYNEFLYQCLNA